MRTILRWVAVTPLLVFMSIAGCEGDGETTVYIDSTCTPRKSPTETTYVVQLITAKKGDEINWVNNSSQMVVMSIVPLNPASVSAPFDSTTYHILPSSTLKTELKTDDQALYSVTIGCWVGEMMILNNENRDFGCSGVGCAGPIVKDDDPP